MGSDIVLKVFDLLWEALALFKEKTTRAYLILFYDLGLINERITAASLE